ncbi:hypothetical protein KI688_006049 [Linnemannia hyalina]|uniref:Uncharacterized protein n=1 Tax=Linnemannia hyalina TaxID=64524 RepID=A0A9P7Y4U5_9FUNG|nr:hypothetical protein KI688_006049 [Linnemannia hyalina]
MSLVWFLIKTTARTNSEEIVWRDIIRESHLLSYERALRSGGSIKESKPMNLLVDVVHTKLLEYGCVPGVTVLHFDGAASDQKFATRQARMGDRQTLARQVEGLLDRVDAILEPRLQMDIDRLYTRSTRQKITRLSGKIKARLSFVQVLSSDVMGLFKNDLRKFGWTVHDCLGESDVCIARKMVLLGNDRKNKSHFREFHMGPILNRLEASLVVWKTAAAVSTNDYSKSVSGLGFRKNLDILKSIPEAEYLTDVDGEASPAAMDKLLGLYCHHPDVLSKVDGCFLSPSYYKHASDVFFHQHEDFTHEQVPFTNDTGDRIAQHLTKVADYLQAYRDCHNAVATGIRAEMQGPFPFGLPPGLGGSPFKRRPVDLSFVKRVQRSSFISATKHPTIPQDRPAQQQQPTQQAAALAAAPTGPGTAIGGNHFLTDGAMWTTSIPIPASGTMGLPPGLGGSPFVGSLSSLDPSPGLADPQRPRRKRSKCRQKRKKKEGCLEEGLRTNSIGSLSDHATIVKDVYACLNEAVRVITDLKRLVQLVIFCYTAKVITEHPDPLNANDREACNARLRFIGVRSDSDFIYKLVSDIFNWHKQLPNNPRANEGAGVAYAIEAIQHFQLVVCRSSHQMPDLDENIDQISQVFPGVRDAISDTLRTYFTTDIKELLERLRESNRVWCESPTGGKPILDTIDIDAGTSPLYRPSYLFWILNSRLPASKQFKFFSRVKVRRSVHHTHRAEHLGYYLPWTELPNDQGDFQNHIHPHDQSSRRDDTPPFFSSKIDYHKSVCLLNPSTIVRHSFKPRAFFDFSLTDRIKYERLLQDSIRATGDEVTSSSDALQAFIKDHLRTPEEYRRLGEIDRARYYGRRRELTGTIQTNGHDLKALVIDVTQRKPFQDLPNQSRTTRMLLDDVEVALETRLMLLASTATAVIMDSRNPGVVKNMTISQGSLKESAKRLNRVTAGMKRNAKVVHQLKRNDLSGTVMTITRLEAHIVPCKTPPMPSNGTRQQQHESWRTLQTSVENHVVSVIDVQEPLRKFYGSASYKIKKRNLKVAEYAIKHKGIDRIMQETGCTDRWQPGQVRPLFIVGDNRGSEYDYYVRGRVSDQCDVLPVHGACDLEQEAISFYRCGQERDRDHNAAHNIAQATLQWMRTQTWPSILSRESQQDNEEDQDP